MKVQHVGNGTFGNYLQNVFTSRGHDVYTSLPSSSCVPQWECEIDSVVTTIEWPTSTDDSGHSDRHFNVDDLLWQVDTALIGIPHVRERGSLTLMALTPYEDHDTRINHDPAKEIRSFVESLSTVLPANKRINAIQVPHNYGWHNRTDDVTGNFNRLLEATATAYLDAVEGNRTGGLFAISSQSATNY